MSTKPRAIHSPLPLLTTFPKDGEFPLKTLIHLYFSTCSIPFRVGYDKKLGKYVIQMGFVPKVICYLRIVLQFFRLTVILSLDVSQLLHILGPMKVFLFGQFTGTHICAILYMHVVSSAKFQNDLLSIFNLLNQQTAETEPDKVHKPNSQIYRRRRQMTRFKIYCYYASCILLTAVGAVLSWTTLTNRVKEGDNVVNVSTIMMIDMLSFVAEVDAYVFMSSSVLLLMIVASTLHSLTSHLTNNLKLSREYCVIGRNEILFHFYRIRKLFVLFGDMLSFLTFGVIVVGSVYTSIGYVWAWSFVDKHGILIVTMIVYSSYFVLFLVQASQASKKLNYISHLLSADEKKGESKRDFARLLCKLEIHAGSVGLKFTDATPVSYAFISSLMIGIFANTALVLQSMREINGAYRVLIPTSPPTTSTI